MKVSYHQNEVESAEKYAEIARESDSYNPAAFVNLGNCHFQRGDVEKAKVRQGWVKVKVVKKVIYSDLYHKPVVMLLLKNLLQELYMVALDNDASCVEVGSSL